MEVSGKLFRRTPLETGRNSGPRAAFWESQDGWLARCSFNSHNIETQGPGLDVALTDEIVCGAPRELHASLSSYSFPATRAHANLYNGKRVAVVTGQVYPPFARNRM
jgi:hypothetical protein